MPIPLIAAGGIALVGGLIGGALWLNRDKSKIALIGDMGVGKTTLFNIVLDKYDDYKNNQHHKSTPKTSSDKNFFGDFILYDTSSAIGTQANKENVLKEFTDKDRIIFVLNGENIDEDIAMKIKCYKNTYDKIKNFKLIVTRANKIQNKDELHNKLTQDGVEADIEFFELIEGIDNKDKFSDLRDKIIKFLEK